MFPLSRSKREPCRGQNALAELEALVVIGGGSFDVGVHHVTNILRRVPIVQELQDYEGHLFDDKKDRRSWATPLYAGDISTLRNLGAGVSSGLSTALTLAWRHIPSAYHERIDERLAELPDDDLARPWRVRGQARWWSPPKPPGIQSHFVEADDTRDDTADQDTRDGTPALDSGVRR